MNLVSGHSKLCKDVCDALGLKHVKSLTLNMDCKSIVTATAEFYVEEDGIKKLPAILQEYYLIEREKIDSLEEIDTSCIGEDWKSVRVVDSEKREIAPDAPNLLSNGNWMVGGFEISDFILRQQRLYHQEENGTWTRPKGGGSWNSITA